MIPKKIPRVCIICGLLEHTNPGNMALKNLALHRLTEYRDCDHYEDCLTEVALADGVFVPCVYCRHYPKA